MDLFVFRALGRTRLDQPAWSSHGFDVVVHGLVLRGRQVVLAADGFERVEAIGALLRAELVTGLIADGDTACALAAGK